MFTNFNFRNFRLSRHPSMPMLISCVRVRREGKKDYYHGINLISFESMCYCYCNCWHTQTLSVEYGYWTRILSSSDCILYCAVVLYTLLLPSLRTIDCMAQIYLWLWLSIYQHHITYHSRHCKTNNIELEARREEWERERTSTITRKIKY